MQLFHVGETLGQVRLYADHVVTVTRQYRQQLVVAEEVEAGEGGAFYFQVFLILI